MSCFEQLSTGQELHGGEKECSAYSIVTVCRAWIADTVGPMDIGVPGLEYVNPTLLVRFTLGWKAPASPLLRLGSVMPGTAECP